MDLMFYENEIKNTYYARIFLLQGAIWWPRFPKKKMLYVASWD
jgi:hypothetical protein